jgi:hypothetical protein
VSLTAKADASGPAIARFGVQLGGINKVGHFIILRDGPRSPIRLDIRDNDDHTISYTSTSALR